MQSCWNKNPTASVICFSLSKRKSEFARRGTWREKKSNQNSSRLCVVKVLFGIYYAAPVLMTLEERSVNKCKYVGINTFFATQALFSGGVGPEYSSNG